MKKFDISTEQIELAIANHFGVRTNLVVPNISWGFGIHECDLLIVSKAGYCTEVEIKVSAADLKKDMSKRHKHENNKIKYLYFAIPSYLVRYVELIPAKAGIFVITSKGRVFCIAKPVQNSSCRAITLQEQYEVARLGALRIWGLKRGNIDKKNQIKYLKEKLNECEKEKGK